VGVSGSFESNNKRVLLVLGYRQRGGKEGGKDFDGMGGKRNRKRKILTETLPGSRKNTFS